MLINIIIMLMQRLLYNDLELYFPSYFQSQY